LRAKGRECADWKRDIKCGTWVYVLKDGTAGFWLKILCDKWNCPYCCEVKIDEWQLRVCSAIPGPHLFVKELNKTGRALSQWIQRHVQKKCPYFKVKTKEGVILITRYQIPESIRKSKDKFLHGEFAGLLRQHFTGVRRITSGKTERKQKKDKVSYGLFLPDEATNDEMKAKKEHQKILQEYREIKNDIERGRWLTVNGDRILLSKKGNQLIEAYRKHVEKQECCAIENEDNE